VRPLVALLLVALLVPLVCAQDREVRPAGDPRLQSKCTKNFEATSLADLLKTFAADTGVAIKAGRDTASDMIVLAVKDKSYGEVMQRIAEHFDFTWETGGEAPNVSYALTQSTEQAKREAKLRTEQEMAQLAPIRKQIAKHASLPQAEIDEMIEKRAKWLQERPEVNWEEVAERRERGERGRSEEEQAYDAWRDREEAGFSWRIAPDRLALARFLNGLSERQWQEIASGDPVTFATSPRRYQKRLPASWLGDVRSWVSQSQYRRERRPGEPAVGETAIPIPDMSPTQLLRDLPANTPPPEIVVVSVIVRYEGEPMWGGDLKASIVAMDALRQPIYYDTVMFSDESGSQWTLPDEDEGDGEAAQSRPDYSKDPILGRVMKYPKKLQGLFTEDEGAQIGSMLWILEALGEADPYNIVDAPLRLAIADSAGVSLISDVFDQIGGALATFGAFGDLGGAPGGRVGDELDSLKELGVAWKLDNGWIGLRAELWAYLRPRQCPRDLVKKATRVALRGEELGLDDLAALVASATEPQLEGMNGGDDGMGGLFGPNSALMEPRARAVLRFWHALSKPGRGDLLAGHPLMLNRLASDATEPLIAMLREATDTNGWPGPFSLGVFDELDDGQGEAPQPWLEPPSPFDWTEYVPQKTRTPLALTLQVDRSDAFYMEVRRKGGAALIQGTIPQGAIASTIKDISESEGEMASFGVHARAGRQSLEKYTFRIHLTDRYAISVPIVIGFRVPDSEFDPKHPPDDVLRLIDESERRMEEELAPPEDEGF
jgi:hypothetical protein